MFTDIGGGLTVRDSVAASQQGRECQMYFKQWPYDMIAWSGPSAPIQRFSRGSMGPPPFRPDAISRASYSLLPPGQVVASRAPGYNANHLQYNDYRGFMAQKSMGFSGPNSVYVSISLSVWHPGKNTPQLIEVSLSSFLIAFLNLVSITRTSSVTFKSHQTYHSGPSKREQLHLYCLDGINGLVATL